MLYEEKIIETIPVGPLGLIPLKGISELGEKVDRYPAVSYTHLDVYKRQGYHAPDSRQQMGV